MFAFLLSGVFLALHKGVASGISEGPLILFTRTFFSSAVSNSMGNDT